MIQVLHRAFDMIALLAKSDGMRLTDLAGAVGIGRSTAGNILSTLRRLGYLAQNDKSEYLLSGQFHALSAAKAIRDRTARVAEENVRLLAERINESVVLAMLMNGERYTLAEAIANRDITVNTNAYRDAHLFDSVTGRVLLAYLPPGELRAVMRRHATGARAWRAAIAALPAIRAKGIGYLYKTEIAAVGVPIVDTEKKVWAAIGVYLPAMRFNGKHRAEIIAALRSVAKRIEAELFGSTRPRSGREAARQKRRAS